ncbi:MAG: hypothetical protein HRO68_10225 [Nitrosopumilus sp.]|nr:hypothetical protein [Nitrosopumilus sp.]
MHDEEKIKQVVDDEISQRIMNEIIIAVKREYEKLNRSITIEQFVKYGDIVKKMEIGKT